jgi:hypothetical protein
MNDAFDICALALLRSMNAKLRAKKATQTDPGRPHERPSEAPPKQPFETPPPSPTPPGAPRSPAQRPLERPPEHPIETPPMQPSPAPPGPEEVRRWRARRRIHACSELASELAREIA